MKTLLFSKTHILWSFMKGIILNTFKEYVLETFTPDIWHRALIRVGLNPFTEFFPIENVDNKLAKKIILAVSELTKESYQELSEDFGCYIVKKLLPKYLKMAKTFEEFLYLLKDISVEISSRGSISPSDELKYRVIEENSNTYIVCYETKVFHPDIMAGVIECVGDYYNEDVQIIKKRARYLIVRVLSQGGDEGKGS
jgi:hypothetical protein